MTPRHSRLPTHDRRRGNESGESGRTVGNDTDIQRDRLTFRLRIFGKVAHRTHRYKANRDAA